MQTKRCGYCALNRYFRANCPKLMEGRIEDNKVCELFDCILCSQ